MKYKIFILTFLSSLFVSSIYAFERFNNEDKNPAESKYQTAGKLESGGTFLYQEKPELIEVGTAAPYHPWQSLKAKRLPKYSSFHESATEQYDLDLYIPAGDYFAIHFDHEKESLNLRFPGQADLFSSNVQTALDKAPGWLRNDLINVFSLLETTYQEKWANAILVAEDPYIDEIAFCIAHLSPQYLMSSFAHTELITRNAEVIYEYDPLLEYVDVIDYGSSETDPDYYSTTTYRKANYTDTVEVEVPREIYYWYIVHPKITDEIPAYIDPDIPEYTHRENITGPGEGYFWREFLFNHADPGYAKFKEMIEGCRIVWNKFGGPANTDPHAINIMNRWLDAAITFTSENDRPHQPVRIYRKHMGRCGEFGDMRVAIARTALIPAAAVGTYSRDHVWNEFWDEKWIHWDGSTDDPMMYIDDWGKEFNSVFKWRSDGLFISVTDRYTRENAKLIIYALDSLSNPIDGARIILYAPGLYQDKAFDNYAVTDIDGKVIFLVAAGRTYWARMETDFGNVPASGGQVLRVVSSSRDGETYTVSLTVNAEKPGLQLQEVTAHQTGNDFYLDSDIKISRQIIRGRDLFDDLDMGAYQFIDKRPGTLNFFMTDENNYSTYNNGQECEAFQFKRDTALQFGYEFSDASDIYFVFDNSTSQHTLQHIMGTINLYAKYDEEIAKVQFMPNYPNPAVPENGGTTIVYQLPQKTNVKLDVYNILGQKVRTLLNEEKYAGQFTIVWDGKSDAGQLVASGIYFCKIKTNRGIVSHKIVVMQ